MAAILREVAPFREGGDYDEWVKWKEELVSLMRIKFEWTNDQKLAYLEYAGGAVIRNLLKRLPPLNPPGVGLHVTISSPNPFEEALDRIDEYFYPMKNVFGARAEFRTTKQKPDETAKDFYIRLKERLERCEYNEAEQESVLKEQFIIGSNDQKLRRRALWSEFESSREAVDFSSMNETIRQQEKGLEVNAMLHKEPVDRQRCLVCHKNGHIAKFCDLKRCYACGELGHISWFCKNNPAQDLTTRRQHPPNQHYASNAPRMSPLNPYSASFNPRFGNVGSRFNRPGARRYHPYQDQANFQSNTEPKKRNMAAIQQSEDGLDIQAPPIVISYVRGGDEVICDVNGTKLTFLVDSGCPVNLITRRARQLLESRGSKASMKPTSKQFTSYGTQQPLIIEGYFDARVSFGDKTEDDKIYVAPEGKCCLLGSDTAKKLGILSIQTQVSDQ